MPAMSPWRAGFFVAGGAIDLAGEEEIPADLGFQGGMELGWEGEVVFDGVSRAHDFGVFAADDGVDHFDLDVERKGGGEAVDVDFVGGNAFGFEEDLLAFLFGELDDFVLDGGAVAGADAFDDAGIHGRFVEVGADDRGGGVGGVSDMAGELATLSWQDGAGRVAVWSDGVEALVGRYWRLRRNVPRGTNRLSSR